MRLNIRLADRYQLWPGAPGATPARPRSWCTRLAEYAWMFGTGALSIALVLWLVS